jgi:hypothetical protein
MGDEEASSQDWVVGCSIRVTTKHTKEVRDSAAAVCAAACGASDRMHQQQHQHQHQQQELLPDSS